MTNMGRSTVAATFQAGGGGMLCSAVPDPSREGSQPPRLPSSRCSVIFSASTRTDSSSMPR